MFWSFTNVCKSVTIFGYNLIIIIDILYKNYVCSCAALSVNLYRSQQCVEHVMYRSMGHIFRVSDLENSYILQHNDTNFSKRPELWHFMPMPPLIKLFVKLLFSGYRKVLIVIYLIYKNITKLNFITSFMTNKNANVATWTLLYCVPLFP